MNKPISEMTPTELRIACAEKMGWKIEADKSDPQYNCLVNPKGFYKSIIRNGTVQDFCDNGTLPRYDEDRNALQELILAVPEENKMRDKFIWDLAGEIGWDNLRENIADRIFDLLTAPPEAIMRAFLKVMEE
jgi:hypothetical protein